MPVDRPTFNESWYRVATLHPRLRSTVQTFRQHFRGRAWFIIQDPANNQFFRLDDAAYHFVGMLDGRRTVDEVWRTCNEELGDRAPTQGEVIQLLGQLYTSNLLQSDLPADATGMFDRYRKRLHREVRGYMMSLLFARFPLFDPDRLLDRWVGIAGHAFRWYGFVAWAILLIFGLANALSHYDELTASAENVLDPSNLILLYISFAIIKAIHEFGHGFACKHFGRITGTGGEVHTMGIMLLVFTPVPYVDASSSWAFRSKWQRAMVGAAGMYVELAVASVAAIVWASTGPGTVHAIAYNMMFIASVSTLVFNGNPLLRFDGYYILSDLLEIPNLASRSKEYVYYLVKRYVYGVRRARSPVHSPGERRLLPVYAVLSMIYRIMISVGIILFVADKYFFVGALFALSGIIGWVIVPLYQFARYLMTSPQLMRVRQRAQAATAAAFAVVIIVLGMIPFPDRARGEGVIEPHRLAIVYAAEDGFVTEVMPSGLHVTPQSEPLIKAVNHELLSDRERMRAEIWLTEIRRDLASIEEPAVAQSLSEKLTALHAQEARIEKQLNALRLHAPVQGMWIAPQVDAMPGAYLQRGQQVGMIASVDSLFVRAITDQELGPRIEPEIGEGGKVEIRVKGRPGHGALGGGPIIGTIRQVLPAGQQELPSAALGYLAGGSMAVKMGDDTGRKTVDPFFEVLIELDANAVQVHKLKSGQRLVIRFEMPARPLMTQWYQALRRLVQRRLNV